jgi:hypothetical protein
VFYAIRKDGSFDTNEGFEYHTYASASMWNAVKDLAFFSRVISEWNLTVTEGELSVLLEQIQLVLDDAPLVDGARTELRDFRAWVRWVSAEGMTIYATGV